MIEVSMPLMTICDRVHGIWGGGMYLAATNSLYTMILVHGRHLIVQLVSALTGDRDVLTVYGM